MKQPSRLQSYLTITLCYVAAAVLGIWVFQAIDAALWLFLLIADLSATLFIWLTSVILNNASVYDPYLSVQPPIILGLPLFFWRIGNWFLFIGYCGVFLGGSPFNQLDDYL